MNWDLFDKQREMFETYIPAGVGFTVGEYAKKFLISEPVARNQVAALYRAKKIEFIGIRAGTSGHPKVYDVVKAKRA